MITIGESGSTKNAINTINFENKDNLAGWTLNPLDQITKESIPFPVDWLPEIVRDQVKNVADFTQTHPDMAAAVCLGVLATCAQGRYIVEGKPGYSEPLNLYIAIFANPGERKSAVMRWMFGDIMKYSDEHDIRLLADDCTPEALIQLMANNNGIMTLASTEGGLIEEMGGRYSAKPNLDIYLKAHCGDPISADRIGRKTETMNNPTLTITTMSQPSILRQVMANDTFAGRGLLARFLYSLPPSTVGKHRFIGPSYDNAIGERYRFLIIELLSREIPQERHVLKLSSEAAALMADYFDEHECYLGEDGQNILDWASKYVGHVLRIAGLLHIADGNNSDTLISPNILMSAIHIGKYFLQQAERAYGMIGYTEVIAKALKIRDHIIRNSFCRGKRHELHALCRSREFPNAKDLQPALELLEERGYIRLVEGDYCGRGRKPDVEIFVNPVVFMKK